MMPTQDTATKQEKTIEDFGVQWSLYDSHDHSYYGTDELFEDILSPFINSSDISGKYVAEIGSGTGRVVQMLLAAGASRVLAIEPSKAFEVLRRKTASQSARIEYANIRGDELALNRVLDYIVSIGVIHHIPDPISTLQAAFRAIKPGGKIAIWVYGREGNEMYLAFVLPLRFISSKLPARLVQVLTWCLYPLLRSYIAASRYIPVLPMSDYMVNVLGRLSGAQLRLNIYDQLSPAYAKYYTKSEVEGILQGVGFTEVASHHRRGYSWTAIGTRPTE